MMTYVATANPSLRRLSGRVKVLRVFRKAAQKSDTQSDTNCERFEPHSTGRHKTVGALALCFVQWMATSQVV
jgi:hypothetical protein